MTQVTCNESKDLEHSCKQVMSLPDIRFCGIINKLGHLIAGGFKDGIVPLESEKERKMTFMQMILDINMRKEHDFSLGEIEYTATKRGKVVMITIPFSDIIVLVSAEPNVDPHQITKIVTHLFNPNKNKIAA